MNFSRVSQPTLLCAALSAAFPLLANAETAVTNPPASEKATELATIRVVPSADAFKTGLPDSFAGGQVAKGARTGVLGNRSYLENPFATIAYINKLIQDKQARSVGEVLQNDLNVRVARGYGNFQESYIIRGLPTSSDDVQFNGLYGLMPRQYIASELFERVEVLRGASSFLNGASVSGVAAGGSINLLPKRAPFEWIARVTAGYGTGQGGYLATDIARRFGQNQEFGARLNATYHDGKTPIDDE
ncbi:TonB-dependent receptor plug domain-containing protein [Neisseriaceae bacterium B1]